MNGMHAHEWHGVKHSTNTWEEELEAKNQELVDKCNLQTKQIKVLTDALEEIKRLRVIPAVIYGIAHKALAAVKGAF